MEVRSTDVQNNFGAYLKYAQFEDVFITRNGKRVAVLRGYSKFCVAEGKPVYAEDQAKLALDEFLDFAARSSERYEFIDGEVVLQSSPPFQHQKIVTSLGSHLRDWAAGKGCEAVVAPFDVFLKAEDQINVVQPDVVVICDLENISAEGRYSGVPVLAGEVLSESTRSLDMVKKLELYRAGGVGEYWIVSPFSQEIYLYTFSEGEVQDFRVYGLGGTIVSSVLEGFSLAADLLFS